MDIASVIVGIGTIVLIAALSAIMNSYFGFTIVLSSVIGVILGPIVVFLSIWLLANSSNKKGNE